MCVSVSQTVISRVGCLSVQCAIQFYRWQDFVFEIWIVNQPSTAAK